MTGKPKNRVTIIGGGPAGLACLRIFEQSPYKWNLTLFEAREKLGGIWYRGEDVRPGKRLPTSPVYDSMTTNLPHCVMAFHEFPFPPSTHLYPTVETVHKYLYQYADCFGLHKFIHLDQRVDDARWNGVEWELKVAGRLRTHRCDFLMIANGHYSKPYIPQIPGMKQWSSGRSVMHSTWYREPSPWYGKRVLVIGAGSSGQDITQELGTVAAEVYHAIRGATRDDSVTPRKRGEVVGFHSHGEGAVVYADGTVDYGIECVVLATGFHLDFPMMRQMKCGLPPPHKGFPPHLYNSRLHVYPLARQIFPLHTEIPPSALAFIGLPCRVVPFPLFEAQAAAALQVFAHPEKFDVEKETALVLERRRLIEEEVGADECAVAKRWHRLPKDEQWEYRRELFEFAGITKWKVESWVIEAHNKKEFIREQWRELLRNGEAELYVRGINTEEGWRELLYKLLHRPRIQSPCDEFKSKYALPYYFGHPYLTQIIHFQADFDYVLNGGRSDATSKGLELLGKDII
ncbi:hypothetical protein FRB99_005004 [Tulasnella sp. 403]|nr:hypothetical protein FRB99_005004 [Tulasnella sp. 403]